MSAGHSTGMIRFYQIMLVVFGFMLPQAALHDRLDFTLIMLVAAVAAGHRLEQIRGSLTERLRQEYVRSLYGR